MKVKIILDPDYSMSTNEFYNEGAIETITEMEGLPPEGASLWLKDETEQKLLFKLSQNERQLRNMNMEGLTNENRVHISLGRCSVRNIIYTDFGYHLLFLEPDEMVTNLERYLKIGVFAEF